MELLKSVVKSLAKTDDNQVILDNNAGIYNYRNILELIKVNCIMSEKEEKEINNLIDEFSAQNMDLDSILYYTDMFESLVNQVLPEQYTIGFSENGDYLIYLYDEEY